VQFTGYAQAVPMTKEGAWMRHFFIVKSVDRSKIQGIMYPYRQLRRSIWKIEE